MTTPISTRARLLVEAGERATPGPWTMTTRGGAFVRSGTGLLVAKPDSFYANADLTFTSTARNDAPAIAAALVEAVEVIKALTMPRPAPPDPRPWRQVEAELLARGQSISNADLTRPITHAAPSRARAWLAKWEEE